ncbi:MAG: thioredoxin [Ruminococcus sp.]|nr:thioredoxin [Ruminococcus sp.]
MVNSITTQEFEEKVLGGEKPALVDFWAEWCGPCKMLSPVVDGVSEQFSDKVDFYKVNVDEEPELAREYGIMSIPTLILFKDGEIVEQSIGLIGEADIAALVEKAL